MVLKDLEELELDVTFVDMKHMNKKEWKITTKTSIEKKAFQTLEKSKQNHSKVRRNKYEKLEIQSYLLPNRLECSKDEIELIFKLRCNMTNLKMNTKNKYETHECRICKSEDESQEHVYMCEKLWRISGQNREKYPEYDKILKGNRKEQIMIAKVFKEHLKIIEKGIS